MKPTKRLFPGLVLSAFCISTVLPAATEDSDMPPASVVEQLRRLQIQVEEQGRRLGRIYRILGPALEEREKELEEEAKRLEQQRCEDQALGLERIREVDDAKLSSLGCVNPVAAEFSVLTRDGGLRLYDGLGRMVKELRQAGQSLTAVAFSPNGCELLAGTESGALLIWDLTRGNCVTVCTNLGRKVDRVTWLGNDRLAWGSYQVPGAVLARDTGKVLWQFRSYVRNDFFLLAGARDGSRLAVAEIPDLPRAGFLLDATTGEVVQTCYDKEHDSGPLSVELSPDGRTLAVGYAPYDIILWDAQSGQQRMLLKGHENWVVSLAFSADGKRLISGAGDSTARVWDLESSKEVGRIRFPGPSIYVNSVGLSPRGDIAFAAAKGMLVVAKVPE